MDIDIFIQPIKENAERTLKALSAFGYDISDITAEDTLNKKILIRQYALETDIHPFVTGVSFKEIWKNRNKGEIEGVETYFAALEDLITMKESAAREKDLLDLKILRKLKDQQK
jgi:predicted nucleotidyltransferase